MSAYNKVSTKTHQHTISMDDGTLTISGEGQVLDSSETQQLLEVLLIWHYGFEEVSSDDQEG